MKINKVIKKLGNSLSVVGAAIFFTYGGQKLSNSEWLCRREQTKLTSIFCYAQELNNEMVKEINFFIGTLKMIAKGGERNPRDASLESMERFKNIKNGFTFYEENNQTSKGYLLLSRIEPNLSKPRIELWDLSNRSLIHNWDIQVNDILKKIKLKKEDTDVLRFMHPLLLDDGSLITHPQPENENTQLLKFDYCGKLTNIRADNLAYHHSIENDQEGNIYVPIAKTPLKSEFYSNYKNFPKKYRNEGIAILDKNLKIKEIIALDKIFHSIGLLEYINDKNSSLFKDPYHLNDIHPYKDNNEDLNLLISMRHIGLLSFNYTKNDVNWIAIGLTDYQHDITPYLGSNKIFTVFDNGDKNNTSLNKYLGNTLVKIDFSNFRNLSNKPIILFGKKPNLKGVEITRYNFNNLEKNLIPDSVTEGRGRFIDNERIFIEETNHGRIFVYNIISKKLEWSYLNKGDDGYSRFLGWSRYINEIPEVFNSTNKCN